jgi:hypothetical protein
MLDKLVFTNHFGAGDLFESREFVKEIMQIIPANKYYYAHGKSSRMFADIPSMEYTTVTGEMQPTSPHRRINGTLFLNTWIGRNSKYVLPQVGCVIDKNYEMFNDILTSLGYRTLSKPYIEYIPEINFNYFNTKNINEFLTDYTNKKLILVCNGMVNSMQAENFDMTDAIITVANSYKDICFLVTQPLPTKINNIFNTSDIIKSDDGFDLNEISYLAKFCSTIIGRKSGPFVFAHNKDVWMDGNKKSLSFTYAQHSSHFVQGNQLPLRKYWSPATNTSDVIAEIERVIND